MRFFLISTMTSIFLGSVALAGTQTPIKTDSKKESMAQTRIYPNVLESTIKRGKHRTMGELNMLVPFKQTQDSFYLMNYIGKRSNIGGAEFNLGFGKREIRENAVHGIYGFIDVRKTPSTNTFYQLTLGREYLSKRYDYRVNAYVPLTGDKRVPNNKRASKVVESTGGGLSVVSDYNEYAMTGLDFEFGKRYRMSNRDTLGIWGGAYYFNNPNVKAITGPMIRAELMRTLYRDSRPIRIKMGLQYQNDAVRGKNVIGQFGIRVDLYKTGGDTNRRTSHLTPLQHRMLEPIVRDVDIVTNRDTISETPVSVATGLPLKKVVKVKNSRELFDSTSNGDEDTLVVVESDITTSLEMQPQKGQVITSGDKKIAIMTPSGVTTYIQASSGTQKMLTAENNNQIIVKNLKGAVLSGITVRDRSADGTLVEAVVSVPSGITGVHEKGKTYNYLKNITGYTFRKQCMPSDTDCRDNVVVDPDTGEFTFKTTSPNSMVQFNILATPKDDPSQQLIIGHMIYTEDAHAQADAQRRSKMPNQEVYKGITLMYGDNFKCTNDGGVWGESSCGTTGKTKIQYVKDVIDRYLGSSNPNAQKIIKALTRNKAALTLFNNTTDKEDVGELVGLGIKTQDLQATETFATATQSRRGLGANNIRNAALEEIMHLIQNHGIDYAMPDWHERLNKATSDALAEGKLNWEDVKNSDDEGSVSDPMPDGISDDSNALPRRDLDDEYLADAVEAYFNMRGGRGYIKSDSVCVSGGGIGGCSGGATAKDQLRTNHKAVYDLVEELLGTSDTFF